MAENHASSISTYQIEQYDELVMKPLIKAVAELSKKSSVHDVYTYMMAKHGIERNERMRDKAVEQAIADGGDIDAIKTKDFSGLTAIAEELNGSKVEPEDVDDFINDYIKQYEKDNDTTELWARTNDATKATLKKWFDSGMITKDVYEEVRDMYKYYIPLRGWDKPVAEDVYTYVSSPVDNGSFDATMKKAKGRTTRADDPLAHIATMAHTTIVAGNKNLMKQRMLWLVRHYPNENIYSINEVWFENVGTAKKPVWKEVYPEFEAGDTERQRQDKLDAFNERMAELKDRKLSRRGRKGISIGLRISRYHEKEHQIKVFENGREYLININTDPTIAQAINGKLNSKLYDKTPAKMIDEMNGWMSANFTTRNPTFILRNLIRDIIYSGTMHTVREGAAYSKMFLHNIPIASETLIRYLRGKHNPMITSDRLLQDFLQNGGETGYIALHSMEKERGEIKKLLKKMDESRFDKINLAKHTLEFVVKYVGIFNRWSEGVGRFATFMTSIEEGRTMTRSISDAKNSTVNFNRKGSGMEIGKQYGKMKNALTMLSPYPARLWLFFNAAVQGLDNFSSAGKKSPGKFTLALGSFALLGGITPIINSLMGALLGDDDEENKYDDVPSWVRRNCFVLVFGDRYVAIPLPIELRAFYGTGEMITQKMMGKMEEENLAVSIGSGMLESISPVDVAGGAIRMKRNEDGQGNMYVGGLLPDMIVPMYEAYSVNEDWLGNKIANKTPYNVLDPEFMRVFKGVNSYLIKASDLWNSATGGNIVEKGWGDIALLNPASVEHLFNSYLGGLGKTINQTAKIMQWGWDNTTGHNKPEEDKQSVAIRDIPILSGLAGDINDRNKTSKIRSKYYKELENLKAFEHKKRGFKENMDIFEFSQKYEELTKSNEAKRAQIIKAYKRGFDHLSDLLDKKELSTNEATVIKAEQDDLIVDMLNELNNYKDE
jgi:hypothetical protein